MKIWINFLNRCVYVWFALTMKQNKCKGKVNGGHIWKWRFIFLFFVAARIVFDLALESNDHLLNKQILANSSTEMTKQKRNTRIAQKKSSRSPHKAQLWKIHHLHSRLLSALNMPNEKQNNSNKIVLFEWKIETSCFPIRMSEKNNQKKKSGIYVTDWCRDEYSPFTLNP